MSNTSKLSHHLEQFVGKKGCNNGDRCGGRQGEGEGGGFILFTFHRRPMAKTMAGTHGDNRFYFHRQFQLQFHGENSQVLTSTSTLEPAVKIFHH